MNKYKYLAFIPLIIWIIIFPAIAVGIGIGTKAFDTAINESLPTFIYWVLIVCVVATLYSIFVLIWWIIKMKTITDLDLFNKLIVLILFNFPAYLLIKKSVDLNKELKKNEIIGESKYKKNIEERVTQEAFIPEWEKKIIAEKEAKLATKKKVTPIKKKNKIEEVDEELANDRMIIRNFVKFVMYKVFKENVGITNTFQITSLIRDKIENDELSKVLKLEYANEFKKWNATLKEDTSSEQVFNLLNEIPSEEFMVAHKQDRVDITIEIQVKIEKEQKNESK